MIKLCTRARVASAWEAHYGVSDALTDAQVCAEVTRHRVAAQPVWTRHALRSDVAACMRARCDDDVARALAKACIDHMERVGEVVVGERGRLASAPLRAVERPDGRVLLVTSVPTEALRLRLGLPVTCDGLERHVEARTAVLDAALERAGGCAMTASEWVGLDRAPAADSALLARWRRRLDIAPLYGDVVAFAGPVEVEQYGPGHAGWGAVALEERAPALVRWRGASGRWSYALAQRAGRLVRALDIDRDHARRLRFAWDRLVGQQRALRVLPHDDGVWCLEVAALLPLAEYRYVTLIAREALNARLPRRYAVAEAALDPLLDLLRARLGLVVEDARTGDDPSVDLS